MADEAATEAPATAAETGRDDTSTALDMEVETLIGSDQADADAPVYGGGKRGREEATEPLDEDENGGEAKKPKLDIEKSVEEQRLEEISNRDEKNDATGTEEAVKGTTSIGYKKFQTSAEMFDYFFKLLHFWPPNVNINKGHSMILEVVEECKGDRVR